MLHSVHEPRAAEMLQSFCLGLFSIITLPELKKINLLSIDLAIFAGILGSSVGNNKIEPPRGKINNVVSEQVRHKPACTSAEKS